MSKDKKEVNIPLDQIPADGALGLLALGDVGVKLWREARKKKNEEFRKAKNNQDEQKES